jgi:hypothetical protein
LSKLDDLISFKIEENDFIDKSLDLFLILSQNINRSNLSKQAFLSVFQNEYFIKEILALLKSYLNGDCTEYEAHITLIIEVLFSAFSDLSNTCDITLLLSGSQFHETLTRLKNKMSNSYDHEESDPVIKDFFYKLEGLICLISPIKTFNEGNDIKSIMTYINDICFNNIQKYNLNEKPINEDNLKDENIKDYVKGLKMNIQNYLNNDVEFLDQLKKKNSLISELFVAVKIINLSVITLILYIIKKLILLITSKIFVI